MKKRTPPNPSIERTLSGKPASASHVKRYVPEMRRLYLNPKSEPLDGRNSSGCDAILPNDSSYPTCRLCGQKQLLFLQFAVPVELGLPIAAESQLSIFMCPEHNEIPSFESKAHLKGDYWNGGDGNWAAFLALPGKVRTALGPRILEPVSFEFDEHPANPSYKIAVGGKPEWVQEPEQFVCSCGAKMAFVSQISDSYKFKKLPAAAEQPDSSYRDGYVLFLGNEVFVFACPNQCNTRAIWVTVQN